MNKRLRLVGIGFLCCSLMVTSFSTITQAKENTSVIEIESSSELDLKQAEKTAIAFIEECYSDGVIDKSQDSDLIAQNADSLRKAIAYRKAIKKSSSISQLKLLSFTVQEVESEVKGPKEIEVFLDTMEKNGEGDSNEITQERQNFYKLSLIKEDGRWRVLKVVSADFTGASLNPKLIAIGKDEFKSYDMAGYDALIDQVQLDREINVAKENKAYFEREQAHYEANKVEIEAKERREEEAYILEKNRELETGTADAIQVTWNGKTVAFPDQQPMIKDGRTLVPLRFLVNQLPGYGILPIRGVISVQPMPNPNIGKPYMIFTIGQSTYLYHDPTKKKEERRFLYRPLEVINGRTMMSVRNIGELFGQVKWDPATRTVHITTEGSPFA